MSDVTRGEIQDIITRFAQKDPKYRTALRKNPKKLLAAQMNQELPKNLKVKVVEDTADTVHLVLPFAAKGDELSDADLEAVAGGGGKASPDSSESTTTSRDESHNSYICNDAQGVGTRIEINASTVSSLTS
jgi:predicted house-cleaning noncanonical NTP pyrophosphatase (MazG superfamily)